LLFFFIFLYSYGFNLIFSHYVENWFLLQPMLQKYSGKNCLAADRLNERLIWLVDYAFHVPS